MTLNRKICLVTLDLDESATPADIQNAYRLLVKVWHPDRFMHDPKMLHHAQEKLKQINNAYHWLKDHEEEEGQPKETPVNDKRASSVNLGTDITPEIRYKMIEEAAFYIAERHGFKGDNAYFWSLAEAEVQSQIDSAKKKARR